MSLKTATEDELKKELIARETTRRQEKNHDQVANAALVVEYVDFFLRFIPRHDTINCNDSNLAGAYDDKGSPRCRRCRLLQIKREGYNAETLVEIELRNYRLAEVDDLRVVITGGSDFGDK